MKSCADVPARVLSKVITTAPARPVPANSLSLLASSVSLNCGEFGLKKLRGCGSNVTASADGHGRGPSAARLNHRAVAEVDAVEIAHRHHRPPGNLGQRRVSRITIKPGVIFQGSSGRDRWGGTVTRGPGEVKRGFSGAGSGFGNDRLTGCLRADATAWRDCGAIRPCGLVACLRVACVAGIQDGG